MPVQTGPTVISLARSLGPFREWWTAGQGMLRLVALVSPT